MKNKVGQKTLFYNYFATSQKMFLIRKKKWWIKFELLRIYISHSCASLLKFSGRNNIAQFQMLWNEGITGFIFVEDFENQFEIFIWPSFPQTMCLSFARPWKRQTHSLSKAWPNKNLKSVEASKSSENNALSKHSSSILLTSANIFGSISSKDLLFGMRPLFIASLEPILWFIYGYINPGTVSALISELLWCTSIIR